MSLHLIHTDKFKTTVMCLLLRQPLDRETATATALIPSVISRGSAKYPVLSRINAELEDMFGAIFEAQAVKKGEEQLIQLYIEFMSSERGLGLRALEFVRATLCDPLTEGGGFKKEYVDGEKANLRLAIAARINNKAEYAKLRALEEMCRGERFGVYGDGYAEDIDGLTPDGVYGRYREILSGSPMELIIMGPPEAGLERAARGAFGLERESALPMPETSFAPREPRTITERHAVSQGKICMGYRTGAGNVGGDVYRLMLMNEVLGGGAGSRLFLSLREKENLCYYINSFVYRAKAIVFVQSGVDGKNFDRAQELVGRQIDGLAKGNVTEAEVSNAKKSLRRRIRSMRDSQAARIDFYMSQCMLNDPGSLSDAEERIERAGRGDVCEMAARMRLDTVFRLEAGESGE